MIDLRDFASLKTAWNERSVERALALARNCRYVEAAEKLDSVELSAAAARANAKVFAYAYYRRALVRQRDGQRMAAIGDLEKALGFGGLPTGDRRLFQGRLTAVGKPAKNEDIARLDAAIEELFDKPSPEFNLRDAFLRRYRLSRPQRSLRIDRVDGATAVGVYRWRGDPRRNETWSRLMRGFKEGSEAERALCARVLAEHLPAVPQCRGWLEEVDFIVPVPGSGMRSAARGADIVGTLAAQLGARLSIPVRRDWLKRAEGSDRSRRLNRRQVQSMYSLGARKARDAIGRNVLLLDDIVTRGHTARACATRLKDAGSARVYLVTLAQSESTLQSERHRGDTAGGGGS